MAILRKSAIALAAVICLGITVPVLAQDKASSDVRAAQGTLNDLKALGAEIKARQAGDATSTPVAAPVVSAEAGTATPRATAKKANGKKGTATTPKKKKKTP